MTQRTYVEQSQISRTYEADITDRLSTAQPANLSEDLNLVRTQIRKIIDLDGRWLDDPKLTLNEINVSLSPGNTLNAGNISAEGLTVTQGGVVLSLSTAPDAAAYAALFGSNTIVGSLNELLAESYAFYRKGYLIGNAVDWTGKLNFSSIGSLRAGWNANRDISVYLNGTLLFTNDYEIIDSSTVKFNDDIEIQTNDIIGIVIPNSDGAPSGVSYQPPPAVTMLGDVIGDSTSSTVAQIRNRSISAQAPVQGDVYTWVAASATWVPKQPAPSISIFGAGTLASGITAQHLAPGIGGVGVTSSLPIGLPFTIPGTIIGIKAYHAAPTNHEVTYTVKNGATEAAMCIVAAGANDSVTENVIIESSAISIGDPISVVCSYSTDTSLTVGATLVLTFQPT